MLMRLQEALADVEQLKADLLITKDPARQPITAPKKKRKAQSIAQHPALRRSQGQSSKLKANVALARGHGDSAGELHSCAFTPAGVGLQCVSRRSLCCLQACRVNEGQKEWSGNCLARAVCATRGVQGLHQLHLVVSNVIAQAELMASAGHSDCCSLCSAGCALTLEKPSSMVPVHQPASRAESQAELDVDPSSRSEEHRVVPSSQNVSHKVQMRAVPSSPDISQKRQMHPRRQQGPLPGAQPCNPSSAQLLPFMC